RRRRAVLRPYRPGRARRARRPRPPAPGAACRAGRPRPPRAADPRRLRRQEHPHRARRERTGAADRDRRHRRGAADRGYAMIRHLLSAADLDAATAILVLDTAGEMAHLAEREVKKLPTLRGRTVVNLFYEDSTRTRI